MSPSIEKSFRSYRNGRFSPCGNYFAISDNYGSVSVFRLSDLERENRKTAADMKDLTKLRPRMILPSESNSATTVKLLGWKNYLLCCFPDGQVNGYLWSDLSKQRTTPAWSKRFVNSRGGSSIGYELQTWAMMSDTSGRELLLAGGLSTGSQHDQCPVLCWEMETGKLLNSYRGHSSTIHAISTNPKCQDTSEPIDASADRMDFLSSCEDGEVRLWDLRTSGDSMAVLRPFENAECARSDFGKWLGCLVSDGEWIVCGGGPRLSLWHIGSRTLVKSMVAHGTESMEHYCGIVAEEKIITAGSGGQLYHWNYRGDSVAQMPIACNFAHDLQYSSSSAQKSLLALGSGSVIDIYSNLIYRMTPIEVID